MEIRKTKTEDIPEIVEIYDKARAFMRQTGNLLQWNSNYPNAETLSWDIERDGSYVCIKGERIVGSFFFVIGEEPTYKVIKDGDWHNCDPYGVIHRVASDGSTKGLMHKILDFCFQKIDNIRIDTHRDNKVMQNALLSYGFEYCGIIYLSNGDERLAYQYTNKELKNVND